MDQCGLMMSRNHGDNTRSLYFVGRLHEVTVILMQMNNSTAPLMNRGYSGGKHSPITSQFDRSDDETIVDEPAPFQSVRNRRHETA